MEEGREEESMKKEKKSRRAKKEEKNLNLYHGLARRQLFDLR